MPRRRMYYDERRVPFSELYVCATPRRRSQYMWGNMTAQSITEMAQWDARSNISPHFRGPCPLLYHVSYMCERAKMLREQCRPAERPCPCGRCPASMALAPSTGGGAPYHVSTPNEMSGTGAADSGESESDGQFSVTH